MLIRQLQRGAAQQHARLGFAAIRDGQALTLWMRTHQKLRWGPRKHLRSPTPACSATLCESQPLLDSFGITASSVILPGLLRARRKAVAASEHESGQI